MTVNRKEYSQNPSIAPRRGSTGYHFPMARPKQSLKTLAKPLKPLIKSVLDGMVVRLESDVSQSVNWNCHDPAEVKLLCEKFGYILLDACFGRAFYTISVDGHLASPVAISMGISNFAEQECTTLYLCRAATELELTMILLAQVTGADISRVSTGQLGDAEWDRLVDGMEMLTTMNFYALQTQQLSLPMLREWVRETAEDSKRRPFVVIDDELLIAGDRQAGFKELSRLAATYDAAIALVHHLPPH